MGRRSLFTIYTSVVHGLGSLLDMKYISTGRRILITKRITLISIIYSSMLPGAGSKLVRTNTSSTNCIAKMQRIIWFGMKQTLLSIAMVTTAFTVWWWSATVFTFASQLITLRTFATRKLVLQQKTGTLHSHYANMLVETSCIINCD